MYLISLVTCRSLHSTDVPFHPKHCKTSKTVVQPCPNVSTDMQNETQTDMHQLTSSELCFTSLQYFKRCFAFASDSQKTKSVFHMTAVLHMTVSDINCGFRLVCLYLVSNKTCKNKTLVSPCPKKNEIRSHIPLSN